MNKNKKIVIVWKYKIVIVLKDTFLKDTCILKSKTSREKENDKNEKRRL